MLLTVMTQQCEPSGNRHWQIAEASAPRAMERTTAMQGEMRTMVAKFFFEGLKKKGWKRERVRKMYLNCW